MKPRYKNSGTCIRVVLIKWCIIFTISNLKLFYILRRKSVQNKKRKSKRTRTPTLKGISYRPA